MRLTILNMDPPKHNRYRRLVTKGFTPRVIAQLEEQIERRAKRIVDDVCERGECEFVEDVAAKLPLEMICEMIGLPESDWQRMFEISNTVVAFDDPEYQANPDIGAAAATEIYLYCNDIAADRRANPRDDLMTALVQAELDGDRLDELELNLFFVTLVVAGNETTRNLISHGTLALIEHPEQMQHAARRPQPVPERGRGDAALGQLDPQLPPHRHPRHRDRRPAHQGRRQGRHLLHGRQPRSQRVRRSPPLRRRPHPERPRGLRRRRRALLPRRQPGPLRDPRPSPARSSSACPTSSWPAPSAACAATSSTASRRCRSRFTPTSIRHPDDQRKTSMHTDLCDQLGIEFPIFAFTHCRDVVAAVSKAGGFGVLGAVGFTPRAARDRAAPGSTSTSATSPTASTSSSPASTRAGRRGRSREAGRDAARAGARRPPQLRQGHPGRARRARAARGGLQQPAPARLDRGHRHPAGRRRAATTRRCASSPTPWAPRRPRS